MAGRKQAAPGSAFIFCILGQIRFQREFERYSGRELKQTKLKIRSIEQADDAGLCHVTMLGSEVATSATLLKGLREFASLTVGETKGFARSGGMVELGTHDDHIQLTINLAATRTAGFSIGADLLSLAVVLNANERIAVAAQTDGRSRARCAILRARAPIV